MKVKQRQGMTVTIKELRKLADDLEKDLKQTSKDLNLELSMDQKWMVTIVNKTKASDTWEFEKIKK